MKYKLEHRFKGKPVKDAIEFLCEEYGFDETQMENVTGSTLLEEKITDESKFWKRQWCVHGQIPKVAQQLIKPKMLTWIEFTEYDRVNKKYKTWIETYFFKDMVKCEQTGYYIIVNDGEFIRVQEGYIRIKFPVIGPILEEVIVKHLKKNWDDEYKISRKVISEKFAG